MKTSIKNVFGIGFCMFGTIVGAGFASGKEIWVYFARWGNVCFLNILITALIFFCASFLFFCFGKTFGINSVQQANQIIYKKYSFLSEIVLGLSNILILSSMFAGADSLLYSVAPNFSYRIASVVSAIISIVVVCFGFSGITKSNGIIVPLLLLCVGVIFALKVLDLGIIITPAKSTIKESSFGVLYSLLFVCSNMFFSGFIFAKMGQKYSKKELLFGGIFGSFLLFLSLLFISFLLFLCPEACQQDMPIVFLGASLNKPFGFFVLFVVWLGLLSTAIAILFTITNWLKEYFKNTFLSAAIVCLIALVLSGIGFSSFVFFVYPIMGVLGFVCVMLTLVAFMKNKKRNLNIKRLK